VYLKAQEKGKATSVEAADGTSGATSWFHLCVQKAEDWRIADRGFLDIAGYLMGLGLGAFVFYLTGTLI